jgi:hypothetical protein
MTTPPDIHPVPTDVVGLRPEGGRPQGMAGLVRTAARMVRSNFWRLLLVTFVAMVAIIMAMSLVELLMGKLGLLVKSEGVAPSKLDPVSWFVTVPLMTGVVYAVLLVLQGLPPRVAAIFHVFDRPSLYLNVVAAGSVPAAIQWIVEMQTRPALESAGWLPVAGDVSFRAEMLRQLPGAVVGLIVLPLAFAAIHVLATRMPFVEGLGRSLRFFWRNPGLAVGYAALVFGLTVGLSAVLAAGTRWSQWAGDNPWATLSGQEIVLFIAVYAALAFGVVLAYLIDAVLSAVFYREFLWRDRQAAGVTSGLVP